MSEVRVSSIAKLIESLQQLDHSGESIRQGLVFLRQDDELDMVFKVDQDHKSLLIVNEDASSHWPVIVDTCSIMEWVSVQIHSHLLQPFFLVIFQPL